MDESQTQNSAPERSYELPYPVEYVGTHAKRSFGKLPVIKVDDLPEEARRNAHTMNRALARAHADLDPDSPEGRVGWECVRTRCLVFQMTKQQYLLASHLGNDSESTIKRVEEGRGKVTVYAMLLQEWPEIAKALDLSPELKKDVENTRELVSTLIVAKRPKCLARLLIRLMYKHGKEKSRLVYETVKNRVQNGLMGDIGENYQAIRDFALCEETPEEGKDPPTDAELYDHPYMKEFRQLHVADRMADLTQRGQKNGPRQKLVEYVKTLLFPHISQRNKTGIHQFSPSVSQLQASAFMRNHLTDISVPRAILERLIQENIIPPHVGANVLQVWERAQEEDDGSDIQIGHVLHEALGEAEISDQMLGEIFDIEGDSRTPMTREKIRDGSVLDTRVPPFAVACLAREDIKAAQEDTTKLYREHATRPYNRGKPYSRGFRTLTQYGLSLQDLPAEFHELDVARYEQDQEKELPPQFFTAGHNVGQAKAAIFVRRWIAMHQPRTVREAGEWLPKKEEQRTDIARRANLTPYRVHKMASGEEVIPLPKMQAFVAAGNARWTPELEIDWHLSRPATGEHESPLARAADTTAATVGEFAHELYARTYPVEAEAPLSANMHRRAVTAIKQGAQDKETVERLLQGFGISKESETGMYYSCLRGSKDVPSALSKWCKRMRSKGKPELVEDLLKLKQYIAYCDQRKDDLREVLQQKKWIQQNSDKKSWQTAPEEGHPLEGMLKVLRLLPGVTHEDLRQWNDGIGAEASTAKQPDFASEVAAEWQPKELTAVEECRLLEIDLTKPMSDRESPERKALILRARFEKQLPLHLAAERPEIPLAKREGGREEFNDDEWESGDDSAFFAGRKPRREITTNGETLQQAVQKLVNS
jgi:hypothetical protein